MKGCIIVFTISGCASCVKVKDLLNQRNLSYKEINMDNNSAARDHLVDVVGKRTVPLVFFNDVCVGGLNELNKLSKEELDKLVESVNETEPPEKALKMLQLADQEDEDNSFQCEEEVDEYAALIKKFRESGLIKEHTKDNKTKKRSFIGKEAVDWLVKENNIGREEAVDMFQQILGTHYGQKNHDAFHDDDELYCLLEDTRKMSINQEPPVALEPISASKAGKEIRMLMLSLYGKHLSEDGRKVDYKGIGEDPEFEVYKEKTAQLKHVSLEDTTREEKLAFFINIYNALVVHAFILYGPPTNMWQRYKFFNTASYVIDGHRYCLQDMENGVLRSNRKSIGAIRKPFSSGDPRLKVALEQVDPRIHFALVCGAKSCPPISAYNAEKIDKQLDTATQSFLGGDDIIVDLKKRELRVSQILKWYSIDFGSNKHEIAQWVHDHMAAGEKKTELNQLISGKFKLSHLPYNWDLNKK